MKCQAVVDKGASRVRNYHNTAPCSRNAKHKVSFTNYKGEEEYMYFCGCHLKSFLLRNYNADKYKVEKL